MSDPVEIHDSQPTGADRTALLLRRLRPGQAALAACTRLGLQTIGDFLACDPDRFVAVARCRRATHAALQRRVDDYLKSHAEAAATAQVDDRPLRGLCRDPRAEKAFLELGITTVSQFLARPKAELLAVEGFGEKTWQKVQDSIRDSKPLHRAAEAELLPPSLQELALGAVALPPDVVARLQGMGCPTFGAVFALPDAAFASGGIAGPAVAKSVRTCLDQLFRVALEQVQTLPDAGEPDWPELQRRLLGLLEEPDRDLLSRLCGLHGNPRTQGELALAMGLERHQLRHRLGAIRSRFEQRAASILMRLRYEIDREVRAFEGVVTGEHLAPGTIAHAAVKATGDRLLPLRLAAFLFPRDFHLHQGCLTVLAPARCRRFLQALRQLVAPANLPAAVEDLATSLTRVVDPVPRGLLLHLLRTDRSLQIQIDGERGEVVLRGRQSVAMRLRDILDEERKPLRLQDLLFHYRDRFRVAQQGRLLKHLRRDPLFIEVGPGLWSRRDWHAEEITQVAKLADMIAARVCELGGRQHVPHLLGGTGCTVRDAWLVLDCLRRDNRVRSLGRGDVCPASRERSSVVASLLADFKRAMGEVPRDLFLQNQTPERRRVVARLLEENRLFLSPSPDKIDLLTNYPFDPERLGRLLHTADAALVARGGYAGLSVVMAAVQQSELAGTWWTEHLLGEVLRRHGDFDLLPGSFLARREMGLMGWLQSRARQALRKAGMPLSVAELLVEQPELAQFAECLHEILDRDPMLQACKDQRWHLV